MNYTQAQIDRANAVSLEDFLRTQGETLIKSGREYRWKEHDSLTVRGNKWFRHSQSKGGYPIDFVMEFYGKSFPEAVQMLTGENGEGQTEATTAPPTAFHLPLHNRTADRAIQYLCESRGLNKTLVEDFLLSGDIYEDAKRHNVVFVGRDRSGTPRYAHVRGTADPFRQDIAGSDKSYPFHYEGNGNQLFVFEAPIDLLSFICLYPQDWRTRSYLALGVVSGKALDRFLSERKDTRKVELHPKSWTRKSTKGVQKSMGKELFSEELKLAVVQYVLEGHTRKEASEKFCVSCTPIEKWVNLYKLHGAKGLLSRNLVGRQKGFDGEFRLKVLQYKQEHHLSCTQTAMHFCLDVVTVCRWEKKFQKEGAQGLMKKQATKGSEKRQKKQEQSELQQENKRLSEENYRLKMENDYLKKLNALIQKREKPE